MKKNYFEFLTNQEKEIIVNKGTESPFSGEYNNHFDAGILYVVLVQIYYMSQPLNLIQDVDGRLLMMKFQELLIVMKINLYLLIE